MDVTPLIPAGRQVIESYGAAGFRVSGVAHAGSIFVFAEETLGWNVTHPGDLAVESFAPVVGRGIEILLLGCGRQIAPIPAALRQDLPGRGTVADVMDTGAACRTYNILLAEERRVAAALIKPL